MTPSEVVWTVAYCTFLIGSAWSFRSNGDWRAVAMMVLGLAMDFTVSLLPRFGVEGLSYNLGAINDVTKLSGALGLLVVLLLATAIVLRARRAMRAYHITIAVTQIAWFLSFIGFLYGLYIVQTPQ